MEEIDGEDPGVFGRVVDADGRPVADAAVMIVAGPSPVPDLAAMTDGDGWFAFGGLPGGRWTICASAPDGRVGECEASIGSHGMCVIVLSEQVGYVSDSHGAFDDLDCLDPAPAPRPGPRQGTTRPQPGWELSTPESD